MSVASVRSVAKNHMRITPADGYGIVTFQTYPYGPAEAVVLDTHWTESVRLVIEAPPAFHRMVITKLKNGAIDIHYIDDNSTEQPE